MASHWNEGEGTGAVAALSSGVSTQVGTAGALTLLSGPGLEAVTLARQGGALVVMLLMSRGPWQWIGRRGLLLAVSAGLASLAMSITFYAAAGYQGQTLTALIDIIGPLCLALIRMRRRTAAFAVPSLLVGLVLASGAISEPAELSILGIALALTSAASWVAVILLNHRLCRLPAEARPFSIAALAGSAAAIVATFVARPDVPTMQQFASLAAVGVLAGAVPMVLDRFSLSRISADRYALFVLAHPIWALGLDALHPERHIDVTRVLGVAITLLAGFFVLRPRAR